MRNLLKAIRYQMRNDLSVVILFLIVAVIYGILIVSDVDFSRITGSQFLASMGAVYPILFMILISFLTTRICGWDFTDRTLNYEILAGHSRQQVYISKICASLTWSLVSCMIFTALPVLVMTIIYGWGTNIAPGSAIACFGLAVFPMIQLISEILLLTFLIKNFLLALIISFMMSEFLIMLDILLTSSGHASLLFLALPNLTTLFDFSNYHSEYINGEDVMVIDTVLSAPVIAMTIISSVLVSAGCLLLGYHLFRKADLK